MDIDRDAGFRRLRIAQSTDAIGQEYGSLIAGIAVCQIDEFSECLLREGAVDHVEGELFWEHFAHEDAADGCIDDFVFISDFDRGL